ncbi:DedA family protein [Microbacterium azadirachtae]|uniref:DedA family protein n=1 Tax=Microbacterium azadirachtae TaxID=582680 RepID=UPI0008889815|nr:VTT domain-containing protein [Microbacterium azadirachtae]SDM30329.1 membrane protein DedA, SNARE-associated domain [Microbacterium azadirachtae]SEG47351.1 membrane protein DedA, SNARE-associated domain [Microbacterium azadirachtae]SEG52318.1 membrane protein DedA, SNARE-associated domain [Microbacterium azadirachtae]
MADLLSAFLLTPWAPLLILLFCFLDGFFPPVPSETVVVGALTMAFATGAQAAPTAVLILFAAGIGAAAGDSAAYAIGRRAGTRRWGWMRRPRVQSALVWAGERLAARPAIPLLVARYIPVGRVAVNMTAGATRLPYRRFLPLSLVAAAGWVGLSALIASVASAWLGHSPLLAAGVGVALSIVLGLAIDLGARLARRLRPQSAPADRDGARQEGERALVDASAERCDAV